ncbi:MAG TPA: SpvB/TcaC N-terminal domain-containing protein, partial [Pyrinomonadaceae bacterium]|nr:SpvB/TcaC N-terminal domain-containing protein [Pyrinomonadaceae bacterium]
MYQERDNSVSKTQQTESGTSDNNFATRVPTISLPKGGGAIRGIGEKFAANPVTGSGSMSVPLPITPGRAGFGPQLALSYDSGAGNGPFGFGWNLAIPSITRKTDKGLPQYRDAEESDVFILSGAEDLVPELTASGARFEDSVAGYTVHRYRPRIEGLFARIERWTNQTDASDTFWRSISRDNVTTCYGRTAESRIADPDDAKRVFSWLICESYDDKGNAIRYVYKPENSQNVDLAAANEKNRTRTAQRYLKHVKYGNRTPHRADEDLAQRTDWLFELVFDYGEHRENDPKPNDAGAWLCRHDPFSTYRAGFEVRSYRLCRRVLMFHHFPEEEIGRDCLVKSTDIAYREGQPVASFVDAITQSGYKRKAGGGYRKKSLPPLEFHYSEVVIDEKIREVDGNSLENLPTGLHGGYQWIDLDGEGIPGILTEQANAWFYKRNLSPMFSAPGENVATFAPVELVAEKPAIEGISSGLWQMQDLAGDGRPDLACFAGPIAGFFERNTDTDTWDSFRPFRALPNVDFNNPNVRFVDLTGDGLADILVTEDNAFTWHASLGETGFAASERTVQAFDEERGPRLVFADGEQSIYLADLSGDGLTDLVRIRNGEVCYWPNLGYGRFGAKVTMDDAPWFDAPDQFEQRRIHLADIDGSGMVDIIYVAAGEVRLYFNQSGNRWSAARVLANFPAIDSLSSVQVVDLLGNGTACLVWSSLLPGAERSQLRYIDLMGGQKPHLLVKTVNNLGAETEVQYASSAKFYLEDKFAGRPWITKLSFPVHVVEKVTVRDKWRQTTFSNTYSYHHGYFDGVEREFRGFGRVEQVDVESFGSFAAGNADSPYITGDKTLYQPPVKTIT